MSVIRIHNSLQHSSNKVKVLTWNQDRDRTNKTGMTKDKATWDGEKGKERVNRMSSLQPISHWNCRRYWEILSVSQELAINTHYCRRNTRDAGTLSLFLYYKWYIYAFPQKRQIMSTVNLRLSFHFFQLWRRIVFKLFLVTSLQSFMFPSGCLVAAPKDQWTQAAMAQLQLFIDINNFSKIVID